MERAGAGAGEGQGQGKSRRNAGQAERKKRGSNEVDEGEEWKREKKKDGTGEENVRFLCGHTQFHLILHRLRADEGIENVLPARREETEKTKYCEARRWRWRRAGGRMDRGGAGKGEVERRRSGGERRGGEKWQGDVEM
eukprot:755872-Hanusia_phi.AAC.2